MSVWARESDPVQTIIGGIIGNQFWLTLSFSSQPAGLCITKKGWAGHAFKIGLASLSSKTPISCIMGSSVIDCVYVCMCIKGSSKSSGKIKKLCPDFKML